LFRLLRDFDDLFPVADAVLEEGGAGRILLFRGPVQNRLGGVPVIFELSVQAVKRGFRFGTLLLYGKYGKTAFGAAANIGELSGIVRGVRGVGIQQIIARQNSAQKNVGTDGSERVVLFQVQRVEIRDLLTGIFGAPPDSQRSAADEQQQRSERECQQHRPAHVLSFSQGRAGKGALLLLSRRLSALEFHFLGLCVRDHRNGFDLQRVARRLHGEAAFDDLIALRLDLHENGAVEVHRIWRLCGQRLSRRSRDPGGCTDNRQRCRRPRFV